MVAQQILVLYVWVRILVGQQHEINLLWSNFYSKKNLGLKKVRQI